MLLLFLVLYKCFQLVHEGVDILELAVDRGETNVSDLIPLLELLHRKLAKLDGGDFLTERVLKLAFDVVRNFSGVDGTLLTSLQQTRHELVLVEKLLASVFLCDDYLNRFHHFKRCESLVAGGTLATTANACKFIYGSGVDNLAVDVPTKRTSHLSKTFLLFSADTTAFLYFNTKSCVCKELFVKML